MVDYDDVIKFIITIFVAGIVGAIVASALNNGTDLGGTNSALIGLGVFALLVLVFYGAIKVNVRVDR